MDTKPKRKGRGISTVRIFMHRRVHELHRQFRQEEGDKAKYLGNTYFAEKIASETGYAIVTVRKIMNSKEVNE